MIKILENYRYFELEFVMIKIFTTVVHTYLYVISRLTEITNIQKCDKIQKFIKTQLPPSYYDSFLRIFEKFFFFI